MLNKVTLSFLFTLVGLNSFAISTTTPSKISDGVALERIQAYSDSFLSAQTVGVVESGTSLIEHTNFIKTKPGLAIMEERPKDRGVPFDRGAEVQIWEYIEGGFSKVIINNIPYTTKIARSTTECNRFPPSPKYCWARVIKEPEYYEWKLVSLEPESQKFWILNRIIDGSGIISVKDEAISKTRLIQTNTKHVEPKEEDSAKEDKDEEVVEQRDDSLLWSDDMVDDMELPDDPIERQFVIDMLKPKAVREKERKEKAEAEKKANEDAKKAQAEQQKEISQEEMFKQQNLTQQNSLNANLTGNTTKNTMQQINTQFDSPAQKLELKANQPLTLPPAE